MITLATLHLASAQEVFTQVKNHLLSQNRKSLLSKDICGYRGQYGTACAAGTTETLHTANLKLTEQPSRRL